VIALEALTNSTHVVHVASLSRATFWMPATVVAHHGPLVSLFLQLRFYTCVSKCRDVQVLPPS